MLLIHGALIRLLGLFGFPEDRLSSISDYSNNDRSSLMLVTLAIVLGFVLLHLAETKLSNSSFNAEEENLAEDEQRSDQIDCGVVAVQQPADEWSTDKGGGQVSRRYGACAFCGNLSTTRCSQCKAVRYCSEGCQIEHWRVVHKYECKEIRTVVQERHSHEASKMVKKAKKEESNGLGIVKWNSESEVRETDSNHDATRKPTEASGEALSNCFGCALCGGPATTKCSRCKAVRYCSAKCLIEDWRWHKSECTAKDVNSTQTETPPGNVGLLKNLYGEEDSDYSSDHLSLACYPGGTTNIKALIRSSQGPTKKAQDHTVEGVRCHEDEIAKSRNEIIFLKAECEEWAARANFAKQRYQSFKKESEHQLLVLSNEKKLISNAEAEAQNAVRSLSERLHDLQIAVQASFVDRKKQEEYIQILESKCAELKRQLLEEWEHTQQLTAECDEIRKTAQIAMREVKEKEERLQAERDRVQLLIEDFRRDIAAAESRAMIAEAKFRDLDRKIRSRNNKVAVWTDSLGRPFMACAICLTNEKDLAFGCGHMTCRDCGSKLSRCPICREQITSFVRLYPG